VCCSIFVSYRGGDQETNDKFHTVGTKIPEFSLPNSRGETVNIRDFEGKKNVVIVLLRGIN
jgi:peroxiredoxin